VINYFVFRLEANVGIEHGTYQPSIKKVPEIDLNVATELNIRTIKFVSIITSNYLKTGAEPTTETSCV